MDTDSFRLRMLVRSFIFNRRLLRIRNAVQTLFMSDKGNCLGS